MSDGVERKKAFLRSYQRNRRGLAALTLELEELRTAAAMPGRGYDGMPHGHTPQDLSGIVARIAETEAKAAAARLAMQQDLVMVEQAIMRVGPGYEREVLTRRYIAGETWDQIADEMHMTARHAQRYHGYALSMVRVPEGWKREDRTKA